ncbi:DMT family transporter [Microbulbifer sp. VTAC004]|uniref:DMT family transporter n=1 Tax=Microbulbifer sp. VTAC004 TaxID=3243386 RepID=UPI00403A0858
MGAWISLFVAGLFEIVWAVSMKYSEGFTKLWPSVITVMAMWISFAFLSYSLKYIPIGTSYAIWVGIGAVGVAVLGVVWFNEPITLARIACISLIVLGVVGLKLVASSDVSV